MTARVPYVKRSQTGFRVGATQQGGAHAGQGICTGFGSATAMAVANPDTAQPRVASVINLFYSGNPTLNSLVKTIIGQSGAFGSYVVATTAGLFYIDNYTGIYPGPGYYSLFFTGATGSNGSINGIKSLIRMPSSKFLWYYGDVIAMVNEGTGAVDWATTIIDVVTAYVGTELLYDSTDATIYVYSAFNNIAYVLTTSGAFKHTDPYYSDVYIRPLAIDAGFAWTFGGIYLDVYPTFPAFQSEYAFTSFLLSIGCIPSPGGSSGGDFVGGTLDFTTEIPTGISRINYNGTSTSVVWSRSDLNTVVQAICIGSSGTLSVCVGMGDGYVYCLSYADGSTLWKYFVGNSVQINSLDFSQSDSTQTFLWIGLDGGGTIEYQV
jgi:hypothetical protein